MKTGKRILSLVLVLALLGAAAPLVSAASENTKYILPVYSTATCQEHALPVLVEDGVILASAKGYCQALGRELIANGYGWWLLPGAGDRKIGYSFETGRWTLLSNMDDEIYSYVGVEGLPPMVERDGELYFPLLSLAAALGVPVLAAGDKVIFYVPDNTVLDVYNATNDAFKADSPLNVSKLIEEDDNGFERGYKTAVVALDVALDIIANKKIGSVVTGSYLEKSVEEALIASMAGTPAYGAETMDKRWKNFDTVISVVGESWFWDTAYEDIGWYFAKNDPAIDALTSRTVSGSMQLANLGVSYMVKTARLLSLTDENIRHAENVFCNERYGVENDLTKQVRKIADEYLNGFDGMEFLLKEGGEALIDQALSSLLMGSSENIFEGNPLAIGANLALGMEFKYLQKLYDYEYGGSTTLSAHSKIQNQVKANYFACRASGDLTGESLQYMLDCAMFNAQIRASSASATGKTLDLSGNGTTAQLYRRLAAFSVPDVLLSIPENAQKASSATDEFMIGILVPCESEAGTDDTPTPDDTPAPSETDTPNALTSAAQLSDMEYGAVLTELEAMGEVQSAFLSDCDADGCDELFVTLCLSGDDPRDICVLVDANDGTMEVDRPTGAMESMGFVRERESGLYMLSQTFAGASGSYYYYRWNGREWEDYAYCRYSGGAFSEGSIDGRAVGESAFRSYIESMEYRRETGYDANAILSRFVRGNAGELLHSAGLYAGAHSQLCFSADGDLDGDGVRDRVFLFRGAAEPLFASNRSETTLYPRAHVETAVVLFPRTDGVLMQSICLPTSLNGEKTVALSVEDTLLRQELKGREASSVYTPALSDGRPAFEEIAPPAGSGGLTADLAKWDYWTYYNLSPENPDGRLSAYIRFQGDTAYITVFDYAQVQDEGGLCKWEYERPYVVDGDVLSIAFDFSFGQPTSVKYNYIYVPGSAETQGTPRLTNGEIDFYADIMNLDQLFPSVW